MVLVGTYNFLQGMGGNPGLHAQALQKLLKETLSLGPTESAEFLAFLSLPWLIKPFYDRGRDAH